MSSLNFTEEIKQKSLNERQKSFIKKLIQKKGQFTNQDLAKIWGAKSLPSNFKKKLLENPPILILTQSKPQKYILNTKRIIIDVSEKQDYNKFYQEFRDLKNDFYLFKKEIDQDFHKIFREIDVIKRKFVKVKPREILEDYKLEISELEKEIFIIYNQLKNRSHQPIKIEKIWLELYNKHPNYQWPTFANQILKLNSKNFHLEEGTAGKYIYDPITNKKYGYVIGN